MFVVIHEEALKLNLEPTAAEDIKPIKSVILQKGHLCIPIIVLITLLVMNYTPYLAAFSSILSIPFVAALQKSSRMGIRHFITAFEDGARNVLSIVATCAAAGIIMGMIVTTGFGFKFVSLVMAASGQALFLALVLTAATSLILGMGLPTAAAYVIVAALAAPALVKMGLPMLSSHMFVQFFACVSAITPPVALAAYAGAAVAHADMMKTAFSSSKLGISAFILPFYFVYRPAIFIQGSLFDIVYVVVIMGIGLVSLASALEGYLLTRLNWLLRALLLVTAILLLYPTRMADGIGSMLFAACLILQLAAFKRQRNFQPATEIAEERR
jgi:TRAP transporter 4TM/12TM fusion protein